MPPRAAKQAGPKGICGYLAEVKESDNVSTVPEETVSLIKRCIYDKIVSDNPDHIAACRSDKTSTIKFVPSTPEELKRTLELLNKKRSCEDGGIPSPMSALNDLVNAVISWAEEDTFEDKKILYFANLSSYTLEEKEVKKVAEKLLTNGVFLSVVLPDKCEMNDVQLQNSKILKSVLNRDEYEDHTCIMNFTNSRKQILNTNSKKQKRPTPWYVQLEITSEIQIQIAGYASTRQNSSETKRVFVNDSLPNNTPHTNQAANGEANGASTSIGGGASSATSGGTSNPVFVKLAKYAVEKESVWKTNDGEEVSEEDVGKAYYFADKLIPFNDIEKEGSYQSGPKCMKLLAFCPTENINPLFLTGDGTTEFYPKKDDLESEVKLKAFMKALMNLDRVAIVRRVYARNTRVQLGVLVPNKDRGCLVYAQLCYADDVSIPSFPPLIKLDETEEEEEEAGTNEKEALIDELIQMKSLDSYEPQNGPTDPNVKIMKEIGMGHLFEESEFDKALRKESTIDIFFQGLCIVDQTFSDKLKVAFPSKVNKSYAERLAGKNVFRKRSPEPALEKEESKKPKLEETSVGKEPIASVDETADDNSLDDLLDEL